MFQKFQNSSIYIPKAYGVKEYSFEEDMNYPFRQSMEDYYFVNDNILEDGSQSILFGVIDGHGGKNVAEYIQKNFPLLFMANYKQLANNITQLLHQTYIQLNAQIKKNCSSLETGATATIGFIRLEQCFIIPFYTSFLAKKVLYMSNVGDSSALLCDDKAATILTEEHKLSNNDERQRVLKYQGSMFGDRVGGVLAVSRAFGDHSLSDQGVICSPYINRVELRLIHKWVVVASDGLWDVVAPKQVLEIVKMRSTADDVAKCLLKTALKQETRDNTSILVLKLY